ncbi:MAG: stage II sporulation protein M [Candidatus Aenigmarchaeota archaeon]
MLESILSFREVEKSPYLTFVWALMIATIGILFSTQLFYRVQISGVSFNLTGMFAVVFTIIPSVYFLTSIIKKEEQIEEEACRKHYKQGFFRRHEKDLLMFLFYFLGVTVAFSVWALILPADFFQVQLIKIHEIRAAMSGGVTGVITKGSFPSFLAILTNNLEVMVFAFIFSLLFGAGAVFIIVWNASILGTAIGEISKSVFEIPAVTLSFLPHGIPEIVGYLCAGLAGGLISAAILRCRSTRVLKIIFLDSIKILMVGIFFILIAAGIEVYL